MKVFITGGSGFIGQHVIHQLQSRGHEISALARSENSANLLQRMGVNVIRGDINHPQSFFDGVRACDGVIHLAFNHDFSHYTTAGEEDRQVISAMVEALAGSTKPLVMTSGTLVIPSGKIAYENDLADVNSMAGTRAASEAVTLAAAKQGVRSCVMRLPPSVHNAEKLGFVARMMAIAKEKRVSAYIGDGENHWSAGYVNDAADLFCRAFESAAGGSVLHAVAEEGILMRDIATAIGKRLDVPFISLSKKDASAHFGWLANAVIADNPASSSFTRQTMHWKPTGNTLLEDIQASS